MQIKLERKLSGVSVYTATIDGQKLRVKTRGDHARAKTLFGMMGAHNRSREPAPPMLGNFHSTPARGE